MWRERHPTAGRAGCGACAPTGWKTPHSTRSSSVRFATRDGDAVAGQDYAPQEGLLDFAPLEVRKDIVVDMLPPQDRAPRHFWIRLSEPSDAHRVEPPARVQLASTVRIVPESLQIGERDATGWRSVSFSIEYAVPGSAYAVQGFRSGDWRSAAILSQGDPVSAYGGSLRFSVRVFEDDGPGDRTACFLRVVALEP